MKCNLLADEAKKACEVRAKNFFLPRFYLFEVHSYIDHLDISLDLEFRLLRDFVFDNKKAFLNNLYTPIGYIAMRELNDETAQNMVPHYFTIFKRKMSFRELSKKDSNLCLEHLRTKYNELYKNFLEKAIFGPNQTFDQERFDSLFNNETPTLTGQPIHENQERYLRDLGNLRSTQVRVLLICNDPRHSDRRWYYATYQSLQSSYRLQYVLYEKKQLQ